MPYRRTTQKRLGTDISPKLRIFLETGERVKGNIELFLLAGNPERLRALWVEVGAEILSGWLRLHLCTRPWTWWRFNATEQRRRLGGTGDTHYDHYEPSECDRGIPMSWVTQWESDFYNGRSRDAYGKKIEKWPPGSGYYEEGDHPGIPISAEDPPTFESEAAYLQRRGLLTPAEVKHLAAHPELLAPEAVTFDEDELEELEGADDPHRNGELTVTS